MTAPLLVSRRRRVPRDAVSASADPSEAAAVRLNGSRTTAARVADCQEAARALRS